jgi:hypothetical protein
MDLGIASIALQVGNDLDAAPGFLTIMPALVISPDLGETSLEVGLNSKMYNPADSSEDADALAIYMNSYVSAEVADLAAFFEEGCPHLNSGFIIPFLQTDLFQPHNRFHRL